MPPQVRFLGGYSLVDANGKAVRLPTRKSWALLAYLVMSDGRDIPREELAALLWPRSSDANARASLRQELAVLRKALLAAGFAEISSSKELVRLEIADDLVDVREMMRLVKKGSLDGLRAAVDLYDGEFLNGLNISANPFEDWQWVEKLGLKGAAQTAYLQLMAFDANGPESDQAIATATALLVIEPTQEQAHRTLMRLYRRLGRRAEALQQYQRCEAILKRELDTEPSQETTDLAARIRADLEGPNRDGNGVRQTAPPLKVGQPMRAPSRESTHTVVLLLSSLTGISDLPADFDPAQLAEVQDRFHRHAAHQVADRGGHLIVGCGDWSLACFGIPELAAMDYDHAIGAAQAIVGKEFEVDTDTVLRACGGLARGRVLIRANPSGNGKAEVVGTVVRQVLDLARSGGGGDVVIGTELRGKINARFEVRSLTGRRPNGNANATEGYLLRSAPVTTF